MSERPLATVGTVCRSCSRVAEHGVDESVEHDRSAWHIGYTLACREIGWVEKEGDEGGRRKKMTEEDNEGGP